MMHFFIFFIENDHFTFGGSWANRAFSSRIGNESGNGKETNRWFKHKVINLPHSLIERIIRQNKIKLNKKRTKSSYRLQTGDLIEVFDISKFKVNNNNKKIKYTPQKKRTF